MMNNKKISVIIPAFNEQEKIGDIITELKDLHYDLKIIVVDDGSSDDTSKIATKFGAFVVKHILNLGQWAALRTAFRIALMNDVDVVVALDADGQHFPRELISVITPILEEEADIVIGSRFLNYEKPDMLRHRSIGIKFFNYLMKIRTGLSLTDCTSGFKAYRREVLSALLHHLRESQYGALEILLKAHKLGARIQEVPIHTMKTTRSSKGTLAYAYNLIRTYFSN